MSVKSKEFQLIMALMLGVIVLLLPRPEATKFRINGDGGKALFENVLDNFKLISTGKEKAKEYTVEAVNPGSPQATGAFLEKRAKDLKLENTRIDHIDGLSAKAKRLLAVLAFLIFLFVAEPIPLEVTATLIGVLLVVMGITDVKDAWASYMHPVVVFIMCCLVFAVALDKVGLTRRLGCFIAKKAGTGVVRYTFILCIGLGLASTVMHGAAACAIGISVMLPLMRAAGVQPYSNTAKFMMLSLSFACSCGGMGTLIGGGRCMASAAFLKEFTGLELSFIAWAKYAMPAAVLTMLVSVGLLYLIYRPDTRLKLPVFEEDMGRFSPGEKKTLRIILFILILWLSKGYHGLDYSITGMIGVALLVLVGILKWDDIHTNLEWGTALFIFGGGMSLGLAMAYSGAAGYFAHLFFPLVQGKGWLVLFIGIAVFGALVTNVMANVATSALVMPIAVPLAQMEGVNPTIIALCFGMATSFAMLLVIGCPTNAIAYSCRYFKSSDLTKAGLVVTPALLLTLVVVAAVWWKILGLV